MRNVQISQGNRTVQIELTNKEFGVLKREIENAASKLGGVHRIGGRERVQAGPSFEGRVMEKLAELFKSA